jgi:hypothetical protein
MNIRLRMLTAAAFLLTAAVTRADDAACAQQEQDGLAGVKASLVIPQLAPTCYGVPEEDDPVTREILGFIDKEPTPEILATALRTLATHVKTQSVYGTPATRDAFAQSATGAAEDVARQLAAGTGNTRAVVWHVNSGMVAAVPGLDIVQLLDSSCATVAAAKTQPCKDAIQSAKAWLRVVQLAETTLTRYSASTIQDLLTRSTNRLAMWHAYRDEALPQFPWEWLLNSRRLDKADKGPNGRPRDGNGQPMGPMKVPTDQIILLHPGVGLEYRNEPDKQAAVDSDESKTAPIIYLEVLGRYRWAWDESTGKMLGGNGISLVVTYADRQDDTEVGYGLMFHSRFSTTYTLGITRSGDSTNVIFNVDLAQFFKDKLSYWQGVESKAAVQ